MQALLLTTDIKTPSFDRRIFQQANILRKLGWSTVILAKSADNFPHLCIENGVVIISSPQGSFRIPIPNTNNPKSHISHFLFISLRTGWRIYKRFKLYRLITLLPKRIKNYLVRTIFKIQNSFSQNTFIEVGNTYKELELNDLGLSQPLTNTLLSGNLDLVISCDVTTAALGIHIANQTGAVLFFDSHEFYSEQNSIKHVQGEIESVEQAILKRADVSYFPNEMLAESVKQKYGLGIEIYHLSNAVDLEACESTPRSAKIDASISDELFTIVFYGWISPERNLENLLEGFARAERPDIALCIIGLGDTQIVSDAIRKFPKSNIRLIPPVESRILHSYLRDCDSIVIPYTAVDRNHEMAFPNKLGDAIELQVPVIADSSLRFISKLIDDYHIGLSADFGSAESTEFFFRGLELSQFPPNSDWENVKNQYGWRRQENEFLRFLDYTFRLPE